MVSDYRVHSSEIRVSGGDKKVDREVLGGGVVRKLENYSGVGVFGTGQDAGRLGGELQVSVDEAQCPREQYVTKLRTTAQLPQGGEPDWIR